MFDIDYRRAMDLEFKAQIQMGTRSVTPGVSKTLGTVRFRLRLYSKRKRDVRVLFNVSFGEHLRAKEHDHGTQG